MKIEQSTEFLNQQILELREQRAALEKRVLEECRLNAMGAEREARLKARVAELDGELSACKTSPGGCAYWRESARLRSEELAAARQEVERLKGELDDLGKGYATAVKLAVEREHKLADSEAERARLIEAVRKLREALAWYSTQDWKTAVFPDSRRAREALAETADALREVGL